MHPHRRRKKRPNYGIRTVEVERGPNGFGFTISGQQPCILSCIVAKSPADQAGLRAGDFLISVNGLSVSKITHDAVVNLIGCTIGPIKMSIAEYYYSDSSDDELDVGRIVNNRKPKYMHKPRTHRIHKSEVEVPVIKVPKQHVKEVSSVSPKKFISKKPVHDNRVNIVFDEHASTSGNNIPVNLKIVQMPDQVPNPIEYKALVGYLGTIEMPKQLLPSSRLQTVCSCIRKLRQEKRTPSAVLMTILPSCLSLKNSNNQILAIFSANRVVYISSSSDKDSRYFGLVTSAVNETSDLAQSPYLWQNKPPLQQLQKMEIEISNSCHVFVTDPKLTDHNIHFEKAEIFKITCTRDIITGNCLEFPRNSLYVVSLVQNMYRLQDTTNNSVQKNSARNDNNLVPIMANSPQPSASSNSDSGIGFRDDCGNVSDRILVVEFPAVQRPLPPIKSQSNPRPCAIDGSLSFDLSGGDVSGYSVNNNSRPSDSFIFSRDADNMKGKPNISPQKIQEIVNKLSEAGGSRNCDNLIKILSEEKNSHEFIPPREVSLDTKRKVINEWTNRVTLRAMTDSLGLSVAPNSARTSEKHCRNADVDTGQIFTERGVDVPESRFDISSVSVSEDLISLKGSVDNISVYSSKSFDLSTIKTIFKTPSTKYFEKKTSKRVVKLSSCENLSPNYEDNLITYKLSPKVYGMSKPNHSCEELNNFESDKCGFGSLQDLSSAVSEPDVRLQRNTQSRLEEMMVSTFFKH